jgi:hypothetical protein
MALTATSAAIGALVTAGLQEGSKTSAVSSLSFPVTGSNNDVLYRCDAHCNRIVAILAANDRLGGLAIESITNLSKGRRFLAGANQQLAGGMAKRTFRRAAFLALSRQCSFHPQRVANRLIFVLRTFRTAPGHNILFPKSLNCRSYRHIHAPKARSGEIPLAMLAWVPECLPADEMPETNS